MMKILLRVLWLFSGRDGTAPKARASACAWKIARSVGQLQKREVMSAVRPHVRLRQLRPASATTSDGNYSLTKINHTWISFIVHKNDLRGNF
jgi:hypothetical protein